MPETVDSLTIKVIGKDDGAIGAESFLEIIRDTVGLLRDLDTDRSLSWKITSASMKSPFLITFSAQPHKNTDSYSESQVSRRFLELFKSLDQNKSPTIPFGKHLIRASRLINTLNNGIAKIEMAAPNQDTIAPTQRVQATVAEIIESRQNVYTDPMVIEGDLKTVSVVGATKFFIYDRLTGHPTLCIIPHERLNDATKLIERRVWVSGTVRFKGGKPMRVDCNDFGSMPERKDLPQFDDIKGIDVAPGEDSVEFVRRHRDAI